MKADLHLHTVYSDGAFTPELIVAHAKRAALDMFAVTDHDTVFGCEEVKEIAKKYGISVPTGIEISAYDDGVKLHTLGYGMDIGSPQFKALLKRLHDGASVRANDILEKLSKNGVRLNIGEVENEQYSKSTPIHSMHIARAGAKKGYCNGNAFNFYMQYLAEGKCANSMLCRPTPEEAVEIITAAGGLAAIAHPGRVLMPEDKFISLCARLKDRGLAGIEAVYSTHTNRQTAYYKEIAQRFDLFVTGGSDAHYPEGSKTVGTPAFYPDEKLCARLMK